MTWFNFALKLNNKICAKLQVKGWVLTTTFIPRKTLKGKVAHLENGDENGELRVDKQVEIKFSIGNYKDKVLCDVVPMEACHILLGRP